MSAQCCCAALLVVAGCAREAAALQRGGYITTVNFALRALKRGLAAGGRVAFWVSCWVQFLIFISTVTFVLETVQTVRERQTLARGGG